MNARCKSCGTAIRWTMTEHGKAMPVDLVPVRGGNIVLRDDGNQLTAVYVTPLLETSSERGAPHYVSHFATCPKADEHRRPR